MEISQLNEDEAIEILKIELENTKRANECGLATKGEFDKQIQAIETILDLYQQEKEKNEAMNKGIDELTREKQDLKTELYMNSVSKDKIRGKLKYATKMMNFYITNEPDHILIPIYNEVIKVCKELLEEN